MALSRRLAVLAILALAVAGSCSKGDFAAGTAGKKPKDDSTPSGPQTVTDPVPKEPNAGEIPGGAADITVQNAAASCLMKRADTYNFVLIFDTSSSTKSRDPANVRRAGALRFVDKMGKLAATEPKLEFQAAALAFNDVATAGAGGWIKLGIPASIVAIDQDITTLTATEDSGTHFDQAFILGDALLAKRNALASNKRQRNFFILMSDGRANGAGDSPDKLAKAVTPIVEGKGIAVMSIATCEKVTGCGVDEMKAIALPTVGSVGPEHVGRYYHAATAEAVQTAWDDLYKVFTTCEDQPASP